MPLRDIILKRIRPHHADFTMPLTVSIDSFYVLYRTVARCYL